MLFLLFSLLSLKNFHILLSLLMSENYISGSFLCAADDTERRERNGMKDIATGRSVQLWNCWIGTESPDIVSGTGRSPHWSSTDIKVKCN